MAKDHRRVRVATERHKTVAKAILDGEPIRTAMLKGGYSIGRARQGLAGLPKTVLRILPDEAVHLVGLGGITTEQQEQLVRGRLVFNTLRGKDSGVLSAKALGSDKRVNMFVPDSQQGVIVINTPNAPQLDKLLGPIEEE